MPRAAAQQPCRAASSRRRSGSLRGRRCVLSRTAWALVHGPDHGAVGLLGSAKALLTRLDGEWWMGHHLLWRARADLPV